MTPTFDGVGVHERADVLPTDLLSPAQVASTLGIGRSALYGLITRQSIPFHRVGRLIRIRERDVACYLARTRVERRPRRPYVRYPQV
jgi:excisionase family DNA binding protein